MPEQAKGVRFVALCEMKNTLRHQV